MSHDAWLTLNFNKSCSLEEVTTCLFEGGWNPDDNGGLSLHVKDSRGEYAWQSIELIEKENLFKRLFEKYRREDLIGLVLTWKDTNIGGGFHVFDGVSLQVSIQINRKTLENSRFTNLNWYVERILIPLESKFQVEELNWNDHV